MILMSVFTLAVAWEFFVEEQISRLLGLDWENENLETHWEFVVTSTIFAAVAIVGPMLIARQSITAAEEALEAEKIARYEAEKANSIKTNFLTHMSHELRTPLNAILGFGQIIRDETFGTNDPRYKEYASNIVSSGTHLMELINDVLDLSKLEAAQNDLIEEDVSIEEIANSSLALIKPQAEANGVQLQAEMQDNAPTIRADKRKLRQILVNILSNAVKFTPSGGKATLKAWCTADGWFVFQVADTGIGMTGDDIPKALSPFQQIEAPYNRKFPGTGLGLPIVKSLVELHDGNVHVESTVGVGTTVTVHLPHNRSAQQLVHVDAGLPTAQTL